MGTVPAKPVENVEWQVANISDVLVHVSDSGFDNATNEYLGMGADSISLQLRTDQIISIDQINGFTLKDPVTVKANGNFTISRKSRFRVDNFRVKVLTVNTNLKVFASSVGRRRD